MEDFHDIPCALTIAGADCGGGAGIQADMLAFAANGVFATTVLAAATAQNPDGVSAVDPLSDDFFAAQLEAVNSYFKPRAAKTGMLFDVRRVETAAEFARKNRQIALVVDPVMISTSGVKLLKPDAANTLETKLIPLATLVTPNIDEAEVLLGEKITSPEDAAKKLSEKFSVAFLVKGGHLHSDEITDALCTPDGKTRTMSSPRIRGVDTHGSGCTLSAAVTANLAKGFCLETACRKAREYLVAGMENPVRVVGKKFINHFPERNATRR